MVPKSVLSVVATFTCQCITYSCGTLKGSLCFFVESEDSAFWLRTVCLISSCSFLLALQLRSKNCSRALHIDVVLPSPSHSAAWRVTVAASMPRRGFTRCLPSSVVAECESQSVQVSTVGQPKALSLSLLILLFLPLSLFSPSICFLRIHFLSQTTTIARWQRMATRSERKDQHGNPEERVVAHQPRKKTFRAASFSVVSQEISLRRIPACSIMFFWTKQTNENARRSCFFY